MPAQVVHPIAMGRSQRPAGPSTQWPTARQHSGAGQCRRGSRLACLLQRPYRRYRYHLQRAATKSVLAPISWHRYQWRLQDQLMEELLQELHHDFSAFQGRAANAPRHHRPGGEPDVMATSSPWRSKPVDFSTGWCGCWWGNLWPLGRAASVPSSSASAGVSNAVMRSKKPLHHRDFACCVWATQSPSSQGVRGTIANRGIGWRLPIRPLRSPAIRQAKFSELASKLVEISDFLIWIPAPAKSSPCSCRARPVIPACRRDEQNSRPLSQYR